MANWTYQCYSDCVEPDFWRRWYDAHPQARGPHDAAFDLLEQMEVWQPPRFKNLQRELKGLDEVKFKGRDKLQWRVFGKADQKKQSFVVLCIGYHKGSKYTPSNVTGIAMQRLSEISKNPWKAVDCERPGT